MKRSKVAQKTARKLLDASMPEGRLDLGRVKTVISRLGELKPRGYLSIIDAFFRLVRLEVIKHEAIVESASELDAATKASVEQSLKSKYSSDLTLEFKINPDLIGGMRVRIGSDVWDGSVKNRLDRLREQFS